MDYMEIQALLEQHQKSDLALVRAQGGSNDIHYARMTGYLAATVISMMRDLPEHSQQYHKKIIELSIDRNEKEAIVARLKDEDIGRIFDPAGVLR
jgi:hypothetical protein